MHRNTCFQTVKPMNIVVILLFSIVCCLTYPSAFADGMERTKKSHEPRQEEVKSELLLYFDELGLTVDLSLPRAITKSIYDLPDAVTPYEWATRLMRLLENPDELWLITPTVQCDLINKELQAPYLSDLLQHKNKWPITGISEMNELDDSIRVRYFYQCRDTKALQHIDALVFQYFPLLSKIEVRIKTGAAERRSTITSQKPSVNLF